MSNELRAGPSAATRSADALTSSDAANLGKVDHVVVVMLENRSFDHMLGYLSLSGGRPEIDGLRPGLANEYQGRA
ncbi:MAG: alkaline phosphatase family protein, partial [Streptosporangiaceae bacterium]